MVTRKNVKNLTASEKSAFVNAVKALKTSGRYNVYVLSHANAVMTEIHRAPAFLTWHRKFLHDLEKELQTVSGDPNLAIPYWNWAEDQATGSPQNGPVWASDLMGGNGDPSDNNIVKTGPFREGQWTIVNSSGNPAGPLRRAFGQSSSAPTLGTQAQVTSCIAMTTYDTSPWTAGSANSFRNMLEGWITTRGQPELHNRGHVWVGGSMLPMTSPNDPVFFLHHCYIDYIFAKWQEAHPGAQYLPQSGGPFRQNWNENMAPTPSGTVRNSDVWSIFNMDYTYDTIPIPVPRPRLVVRNFGYRAGGWRIGKHPRILADTTGDRKADVIGFGNAGVYTSINNGNGTFQSVRRVVNNFGYNAGGWRVTRHPRFMADLTGDRRADIVGFGNAGVYTSINNGSGSFGPVRRVVDNFGYTRGGWRVGKHPRFMADLTGDRRADIIGFGNAGVYTSINNGSGAFGPIRRVVNNFGYNAGGWRVGKHPRFMADITGDRRADIIGFGNAGVYTAINNGSGSFGPIRRVINNFGYNAGGWRVDRHPRFVVDITGNGRADIVGFGNAGVYVALNNGNGTFQALRRVVNNFGYNAGGWRVNMHPRLLADTTGNGLKDIVGFGNAGVYVSLNQGNGNFANPRRVVNNFGYNAGGWRVNRHPRFLADMVTINESDIVGFGNAGVYLWEF